MLLTTSERLALAELARREQDVATDRRAVVAEIEARLGLEGGALGTTHGIDPTGRVVPRPAVPADEGG